ncbi:MAG TPA: pyridoxamine 5'-phosphate oxidase family protein [Longimicrobium sp.]|nr:pyridoxamine 5'-phosphate oxidase family protein [Longimicrobium sp.]
MSTPTPPTIRALDRRECEEILARNHVGRLAYTRQGHVDIEPLHYVYSDGWIYGRTSHGAKMDAVSYTWAPVAFEVDEVEGLFHWRSVVLHGGFYAIPEDGAEWEQAEWRRGLELLRELIPETLAPGDPVGFRTVLFRVAVQDVTGREALPGGG